jgi:hypothetical protein
MADIEAVDSTMPPIEDFKGPIFELFWTDLAGMLEISKVPIFDELVS